jgi:cytochrome P450
MSVLINPISAATHPNPYPYYLSLLSTKPLFYDEGLKLWIASSAHAVTAVLESKICRVRPMNEAVPKTLLDSPAADIFRHLVRMNDGIYHHTLKEAVTNTLQPIDINKVRQLSQEWSQVLARDLGLSKCAFQLSVYVIGSLLGIPRGSLSQTTTWIDEFVRCLAPGSNAEHIETGKKAAGSLLEHMQTLLRNESLGLLSVLAKHAGQNNEISIIANGIGFLSQAYEATAGLISNSLLLLARNPDLREAFRNYPTAFIQEVLRYDSPIQNTRRFIAEDGMIAGQTMQAGDAILVILAAANYDSSVNPNPYTFDAFRNDSQLFTFGLGKHACPGEKLAVTMAQAALEHLVDNVDLTVLNKTVSYRPSTNTRIPLFS